MADILTPEQYSTWLDDALLSKGSALERAVGRAERDVIRRYRGKGLSSFDPLRFSGFGATVDSPVQLDGWADLDDGTPDVANMPDDLVEALRDTIARIVTYRLKDAPDPHVALESQGSRSKAYRSQKMPPSVYAPLSEYDERTPAV